ncbi:MAG: hypothetical protein J0H57_10655 [Rhodospirillales bacterium]|nr:hypothetical protein [Rhodospirillales bacterium]
MTGFHQTFFGKLVDKIVDFFKNSAEPYVESLLDPVVPEIKALTEEEVKSWPLPPSTPSRPPRRQA